ncbi:MULTISPECIES: xanthine dehydrogenase family protein molybdopterin-binding subunit [unclassified Undibacterium]|uniref:xanthine dehydrogenase family protein molybdopterin-binding subunit n=1 Tax=unclassified Undibacterium TaxID=2630295 RepID=UPI002AC973A8|nr:MULTISPECIES: xanthine dehydrogenase family protein molybdopterin-binding subunit [unclassified Undibacterium]MEB0139748.1 xanthine dehydrogenase family protein molybdopterin-binding subunit [Undibacterium sp. CCC2.1]MEB0172629.1 xanthine dehydrogenase family protein molybdopterin-binding subunit [Undibacterium sp. CCC1.1]MEB0176390.1 xanthine dehydrogenase family protein molybdopterin-binding subunit [Undibacterium sp. CCC3.4]MEB0215752.1 xanthine dehydrogenase family protein molybdopterin-
MLPHIDYSELPRALQHLLARDQAAPPAPSRRNFLKLAAVSGFALGAFPGLALAQSTDKKPLGPTQQPSAFVEIAANGAVTVTINRLDFGQGVQTALPMILAEELDADWSKVHSRHGSNDGAYVDPKMGMHITGGSNSIKNSFMQYRELGARARAMLLAAAASEWHLDVAQLRTENGAVIAPDGRQLSYGQLAAAAMQQTVPETVVLKDIKDFRLIGRPTTRLDAVAKSSGKQDYGIDMHLPGQLTALVLRPPVFGSKIASLDDTAARAIAGVKAVLRVPLDRGAEGVAVIADGYWPAKLGRDALKLSWDSSAVEKVDSVAQLAQYRALAKQPGKRHFDADMAPLQGAARTIEAEFHFPYLAHAPMEPLNCTVRIDSAGAELWLGSQMPGIDGVTAARVLDLKPEQVKVHVQMAGGGFGRRAIPTSDYVFEACGVAKAARSAGLDAPIRTLWSREDDIRGGYYRPAQLHHARIGLDAHGKVLAWEHVIVGQSIAADTFLEGFMIKNGIDNTAVEGMREPYDLPMRLTVHHPKLNVPVLWWRSVGSTHTAFVMETLIDDIARSAKQDPVAYRMQLFGDKHLRHRAALQLAVDHSGYGKKRLAKGHAWGVAVHESFQTVVAYVVEASIQGGRPVLHRATAGVHCNLAVNPRTIEAQVQGAALMGLSMCLPGAAITFKDGVVEQSNFGDYVVPRITDMPDIAVHVVPSADAPTGMGEPGLPPLAPAFANAIATLTGKAMRELPFKFS